MSDDQTAKSPPPKSRGGGKSKHPREPRKRAAPSESEISKLAAMEEGESGNPLGQPKSVVEIARLAREHSAAAIERLSSIMMNDKASHRDQIAAAVALLDRGCGRPPLGIYHSSKDGSSTYAPDTINGEAPSPLLLDASRRRNSAYADELRAELRRIDAEEARERVQRQDEVEEARAAMARGEEVSPLMKMLVQVREATD